MSNDSRHTTATLAIVRPTTAAPCYWCGFKRADHYGNATVDRHQAAVPDRSAARSSFGGRMVLEPTYTASN